jgi:hypothetical protein
MAASVTQAQPPGSQTHPLEINRTQQLQASRAAALQRIAQAVHAAPAMQLSPAATATTAPTPAASAVMQPINRGELYHVALTPQQEAVVTSGLRDRLSLHPATPLVTLPGALTQQAADGAEVQLKALAFADQDLARSPQGDFTGSIKVGVMEIGQSGPPRALTAPVLLEVIGNAHATPPQVNVTQTSPPFKQVLVSAPSVGGGKLVLRIASTFDPEGVEVDVPVAKALSLSSSTPDIDGFGLEAADLHVSAPEGAVVNLSASGGYLDPSSVVLGDTGETTAHVRASSVGSVTVTATSSGFAPVTSEIQSKWPVLTLGAAAFGGLVGGVIRFLSTQDRRGHTPWALVLAVLTGLVVFGAYTIGVNLLPVHPTVTVGRTFVFVVAALGGYAGPGLLSPKT